MAKNHRRKSEATNLLIPADVKGPAQSLAASRNLSLSQLVADLLAREILIASATPGAPTK